MICRGARQSTPLRNRHARTLLTLTRKAQPAKRGGDMEVRFRGIRCLPCRVETWLFVAFDAKEIDSPDCPRIKAVSQRLQWDCHFRCPPIVLLIQPYRGTHSALQILQGRGGNVEIDPQAI